MLATKLRSASLAEIDPAWDLAYAVPNPLNAWDISEAVFFRSTSVAAQETVPQGLFFRDNGRQMFIIGTSDDLVNDYQITKLWDTINITFFRNFSVSSQEILPQSVFFKPDGLSMYILGTAGKDVNQYTLSTAWNISTATFLQNFSVAAQETQPRGVFFKPDGLSMYIIGSDEDNVNQYTLSTAWDISTATFLQLFSVNAQEAVPQGLFFKPDGLSMYIVGSNGEDVNQYTLSTAWDISTATYLQNFSVAAQEDTPTGLFFRDDGLIMYVIGLSNDSVLQYDMRVKFSVAAQEIAPTDVFFKPDGLSMYIVGTAGDDVNQYTLSTAWDITTATYLQNFSVAAQDGNPQDVFFKPDGLSMYIVGQDGKDVNQYTLSTAWDISTATYLQNFSAALEENFPQGLFFKPDGLSMYIIGISGDEVNQYTLSTAWDISTATFLQLFSVAAQETNPRSIFFKPDGLSMYIIGTSGEDINQYTLSTAWDISTATFLQNFIVTSEEYQPRGLFFKPDGLSMYIIGQVNDTVFEYVFQIEE